VAIHDRYFSLQLGPSVDMSDLLQVFKVDDIFTWIDAIAGLISSPSSANFDSTNKSIYDIIKAGNSKRWTV
jgi:hypothetical protein